MTNPEFSNEFDILYNNIASNQAPGLDEYEKSVFLTKAQDEILKNYFNPKGNKYLEGFDENEKRQIDFSMITKTEIYKEFDNSILDNRENSKSVNLNSNILMIINEFIDVSRDGKSQRLVVIPLDYKEYSRLISKPYKRPLKFQAWRVINSSDLSNRAELIVGSNDTITSYSVRYVKKPRAIILTDLPEGITLDNSSTEQACELDPILHQEILQRAVELAKAAYLGDLSSNVELGKRSE